MKRRIGIVTGSRAEYGLLYWVIKAIHEDKDLELNLYVTGSHLEKKFGNTLEIIKRDGFPIKAEIPLGIEGTSLDQVLSAHSQAIQGFAKEFSQDKPDLLVFLGDRYEIFAVAQVALFHNIPMAHIHGGESTEGAIDDGIRHSLTKLSHYHFASAEPYKKRIIQLGEHPERVFNVGAPGLDSILQLPLLEPGQLLKEIKLPQDIPFFLITYHPLTLDDQQGRRGLEELKISLAKVKDSSIIWTLPGADPQSDEIFQSVKEFAEKHEHIHVFTSLGQLKYLSAMKHAQAVIGNSSSGIIEAPLVKTPTINIGNRQGGRIQGKSIIQVSENSTEIDKAISQCVDPAFLKEVEAAQSPYGNGGASNLIVEKIKELDLSNIRMKKFYDLEFTP